MIDLDELDRFYRQLAQAEQQIPRRVREVCPDALAAMRFFTEHYDPRDPEAIRRAVQARVEREEGQG